MLAKFVIEHPVLANVIALVTMLLDGVALMNLPAAQYPPITPIRVDCTWDDPLSALADYERSPAIDRRVSVENNPMSRSDG
jgi:hypothetical protein